MIELKTAIKELKSGAVEFSHHGSSCLTEGELILLLEELESLRKEINPWIPYPDV